jgi:hypothetical protein
MLHCHTHLLATHFLSDARLAEWLEPSVDTPATQVRSSARTASILFDGKGLILTRPPSTPFFLLQADENVTRCEQ